MLNNSRLRKLRLIYWGAVLIWLVGGGYLLTADGVDLSHFLLFVFGLIFGAGGLYALYAWQRALVDHQLSMQALEHRTQELNQQIERLGAVHQVANALSETVELPELLGQGLERAISALGLDGGQVHLKANDEDQVMHLSAVFGEHVRFADSNHTVRVGECVCGKAAAEMVPVVVEDAATDQRLQTHHCAHGDYPCVASVPLKARGGSLGVLTVRSCDPQNQAIKDIELLMTVANFLAAAIENARIRSGMENRIVELTAEVEQLAIVQERERIGREMHDGLAQTLGLLNVQIEMVKEATHLGDLEAAEKELALLDTYLGNAYAEVRQALTDLRTIKPQGKSLVASLGEIVEQYGYRNQIEAVFNASEALDVSCLPSLAGVQLQRVVQEALNNIRRHADASRVEVSILPRPEGWEISIADNGKGFDVEQVRSIKSENYGLLIMQERIEELGGQFSVVSSPQNGTKVLALIPCEPDRSVNGPLAHSTSR